MKRKQGLLLCICAASLGVSLLLTGCGKSGGSGLSQSEVQQIKNAPAPGSTPPPEARAALQRMQSGAKAGPPPAK